MIKPQIPMYKVRVQINYPSPFMEINSKDVSKAFSDKDAAYSYYNDLVNNYSTNKLLTAKITLSEYDIYRDAGTEQRVIESWSNMDK